MAREHDACPVCGLAYDAFRTGLTFGEVRREMFVDVDDSSRWRQKRRHCVLGFWHERKVVLFRFHVQECEHYAALEAAEKKSAAAASKRRASRRPMLATG